MRKIILPIICLVLCLNVISPSLVSAEEYIGEIRMFAGNFAPRNWAYCNGQLLSIAENTALFAIIGTTYGGDGRTNFALPDLRGRVPLHAGSGPGLTNKYLGQMGGYERVTLSVAQIPSHTHQARASSETPDTNSPEDAVPATKARTNLYTSETADVNMGTTAIANTGGSQAHDNMPPFLTIHYIISLYGVYPSRP